MFWRKMSKDNIRIRKPITKFEVGALHFYPQNKEAGLAPPTSWLAPTRASMPRVLSSLEGAFSPQSHDKVFVFSVCFCWGRIPLFASGARSETLGRRPNRRVF